MMRPMNILAVMVVFVGMIICIGCVGIRWAEKQTQAYEQRHQQAMSVLK